MNARGAMHLLYGFSLGIFALTGCGGDEQTTAGATSGQGGTSNTGGAGGSGGEGGTSSTGGAGGAGGSSGVGGSGGAGGAGGQSASGISCKSDPPPGAELAPPPPAYTGGACPAFAPGLNTFKSMGNDRSFLLVLPSNPDPAEKLPVIFLWHWLGGSADDFLEKGQVQAAADSQRFIAVIPQSKGDLQFQWPFDIQQKQARIDEEFTFFDDMLSCVSEQFSVNSNCVASGGVSAGALFTDQLAGGRGQYLSSILSLSGGVGGVVRPWTQPDHRMAAMVLWGGPTDQCFGVLNFETASKELEKGLDAGNHFYLECVHNCGHAEPPFEPAEGFTSFAALWQFVFDHPYWLKPGTSPYTSDGIPKVLPTWCGIGAGSAVPRTGECPNPAGC
jgi:predicted esterase